MSAPGTNGLPPSAPHGLFQVSRWSKTVFMSVDPGRTPVLAETDYARIGA
jgi:hypothetical protein